MGPDLVQSFELLLRFEGTSLPPPAPDTLCPSVMSPPFSRGDSTGRRGHSQTIRGTCDRLVVTVLSNGIGGRGVTNKKALSESDICDRYITPAIEKRDGPRSSGDGSSASPTARSSCGASSSPRGKRKRADYLLFHKPNLPIAVDRGEGQQPLGRRGHAAGARLRRDARRAVRVHLERRRLPVPRPDRHVAPDRAEPRPRRVPVARRAVAPLQQWKGLDDADEALVTSPNYAEVGGKEPRYYQQLAINRTVEAVAEGQKRLLLVMATGTGKTYTAFHIIWRLWKTRTGQAGPVPRRPQHPRRPDDPERLQAVRRGDEEAQPKPGRRAAAESTRPTRSTSRSTRRSWAPRTRSRSTTSSRATSSTSSSSTSATGAAPRTTPRGGRSSTTSTRPSSSA